MLVLGLQGSPRIQGNSNTLLSTFLAEAERLGAQTHHLNVSRKHISPCLGCGNCEKTGFCITHDDMQEVFAMLRQADIIVMATPVYFYGPTAQIKALIDRSQTLWARKYVHKLTDPGRKWRHGLLLSVGATKGKNLFDGINLTTKYFFDAVGASFDDSLTYRKIEKAGQIKQHPTALTDVSEKARAVVTPLINRKKILFVCSENACRSQMAAAFAKQLAGDRIEAASAGSTPAEEVNPVMQEVMAEKSIDMAFVTPKSLEAVASRFGAPDLVITMGCQDACPVFPDLPLQMWELPDPANKPIAFMRQIRDEIEKKVGQLVEDTLGV